MTIRPSAPRTAGLDTLRALAIALVFAYHDRVFVSGRDTFGWASVVGWSGVDLFFVLSGYLIANPLFAGLAQGRTLSPAAFYARRGWRTLPLYWLVLAAYLAWPDVLGGRTPPPAWRFLTFTQNLGLQPGTAFSHAWSLCVEEQFYLALPLVPAAGAWLAARAGARAGSARWRPTVVHGWLLLAALAAAAMATRGWRWFEVDRSAGGDPRRFMPLVYYATACRFDEFLPGIAVAMLKNFHPRAWSRALAHGRVALVLGATGAVGVLALAYREDALDNFGFVMTTFGYSLLATSFALLVVAALSPATALHRRHVPGAASLARWSYAIYLSHKPLAHVLKQATAGAGIGDAGLVVLVVVACVATGALLHRLVEAPFLAVRDRRVPSSFREAAPPGRAGAPAGAAARVNP